MTNQLAGARSYQDRIGRSCVSQMWRDCRWFSDRAMIGGDDEAGGYSGPHLQWITRLPRELGNSCGEIEPGVDGAFRIVLVRYGIAEQRQNFVSSRTGN